MLYSVVHSGRKRDEDGGLKNVISAFFSVEFLKLTNNALVALVFQKLHNHSLCEPEDQVQGRVQPSVPGVSEAAQFY